MEVLQEEEEEEEEEQQEEGEMQLTPSCDHPVSEDPSMKIESTQKYYSPYNSLNLAVIFTNFVCCFSELVPFLYDVL